MHKRKPIIIAGFGRSGTTWLSDIISKALGGIILFEPYHPCVFEAAKDHIYATDTDMDALSAQWQMLHRDAPKRDRWLLRNHLRSPIEDISQHYVDEIWEHCDIIGFKTIRLNHQLDKLRDQLDGQLVFILRHPLAVISSIMGRDRFWEEFGWDWHWNTFITKTDLAFKVPTVIKALLRQRDTLKTNNDRMAYMWAVSTTISLDKMDEQDIIVRYEDLYNKPYQQTREILDQLGHPKKSMHPAYIFEPSMTTLRTFHNSGNPSLSQASKVFWQDRISDTEASSLIQTIRTTLDIIGYANPILDSYLT